MDDANRRAGAPTGTIRPMTAADDLAALTGPDPMGWLLQSWQDVDVAMPIMSSWVAEVDGQLVGWAAAIPFPLAAGGFGVAHGRVDPAFRRRGIGTRLRAGVHDALTGSVAGVQYSYDEDDPDAAATAAAWGLRETRRHAESVLDLRSLDRGRFDALADVDGVEFRPLDPAMTEEQWADLHAFAGDRFREAPDTDDDAEFAPLPVLRHGLTEPWTMLVAERAGRRIGLTFVMRRPGSGADVNTWFTGVSASERGRGIATALKVRQATAMAAAGIERVFTQNMDGNDPILRANATLGFRPSFRYVDVEEPLAT